MERIKSISNLFRVRINELAQRNKREHMWKGAKVRECHFNLPCANRKNIRQVKAIMVELVEVYNCWNFRREYTCVWHKFCCRQFWYHRRYRYSLETKQSSNWWKCGALHNLQTIQYSHTHTHIAIRNGIQQKKKNSIPSREINVLDCVIYLLDEENVKQ